MGRPETYYAPRRRTIAESCIVAGGLLGGLWRGASTWLLLLRGLRRRNAAGGLFDLEWSVVKGAVFGALAGAAVGWIVGVAWERWHRRRRARRVRTLVAD